MTAKGINAYLLLPESPLFFGSGREFSPQASTWDEGMIMPTPSTLFGAFARRLFHKIQKQSARRINDNDIDYIREIRKSILEELPKFVPVLVRLDSPENLLRGDEIPGRVYIPAPPLVGEGTYYPALVPIKKDGGVYDPLVLRPTTYGLWGPVDQVLELMDKVIDTEISETSQGLDISDFVRLDGALSTEYSVGLEVGTKTGAAEIGKIYRIRTVSPRINPEGRSYFLGFITLDGKIGNMPEWVTLGGERRVSRVVKICDSSLKSLSDRIIKNGPEVERMPAIGLLITPGIYLENKEHDLFRTLYLLENRNRNGGHGNDSSPSKTVLPKGHVIPMNLPMTYRSSERIFAVFRAAAPGSILWLDEEIPVSFAHEIGFGLLVRGWGSNRGDGL